jgi:hypothetical protein
MSSHHPEKPKKKKHPIKNKMVFLLRKLGERERKRISGK